MGLLNIGSLVLGLIAWILPATNLMRDKKKVQRNGLMICFLSMGACAISISFQIFYSYYLVKMEDWSAMMDTSGGVVVATAVLLSVTIF
ncbi:hypothetical protein [Niallia circulans]|uniref:hypothetical protein n=1 Tax=Niallia circulans TaxID=1397 RepID=UPI0019D12ACC|nr:hypothetical protein [Niallia circulans]